MKEYALIGHPLEHSLSKEYFTTKFQSQNIEARYINLDLPSLLELRKALLHHPHLMGFNVTSPYKIAILDKLYDIEDEARYIGAVNTVVVKKNSFVGRKLYGFNTDIEGFTESVKPLLAPHHTRALILGTGGAAKAVHRSFRKMGIDTDFVSRRKNIDEAMGYDEISKEVIEAHPIIVNATPQGMYPFVQIAPPIPYQYITSKHLCYDLIYTPEETLFLEKSKEQGATIKNGLDMLLIQAEEAWRIWQEF